jgi:hypothetical protein
MKKKVVLFIEWANIGRDLEMNLPVMYFFEKILKWEVRYKHINNVPDILSTKPNLVIMSSISGADIYVEIAQYIQKSKIPLLVNTTEGFFREGEIREFVWGWNKSEIIYESVCNYWSYKSYNMMLKHYPQRLGVSRVCGSLGHDKYIFLKKQKTILTRYEKIIGYAAFDFNRILSDKKKFADIIPDIQKNLDIIKNILKDLIINNKDILFIIKSHPSDMGKCPLEVEELEHLDNIKILPYSVSIVEAISNSDIWMSFSSGSILEAWLQKIPTISFLTNKKKFSSETMHGSVLEDNPKEINRMIREFYINNAIERFSKKHEKRNKLIKDMICYSDGLNHVRYMSILKPFIDDDKNIKKNIRVPFKYKFKGRLRYIVYRIANNRNKTPFLKKYAHIYGNWNLKIFYQQRQKYYDSLDVFYSDKRDVVSDIYNNYESNYKEKCINE